MKRTHSIAVIAAVSLLGFLLGRATGDKLPVAPADETPRVFPLPAKPPHGEAAPPPIAELPLIVETPAEGATLDGSFDVAGRARLDGKPVSVSVQDGRGATISSASVALISDGKTKYGRFAVHIVLPSGAKGQGIVRVIWESSDGKTPAVTVTRKVTFGVALAVEVRAYFPRSSASGNADCALTFGLARKTPPKSAAFEAALGALLLGPTASEKAQGYFSAIPASTKLKSVTVDSEGVATADFSSALEQGAGGSCRVGAIRAQITETLLQFPEIHSVVISVAGKTDGVLQP